MLRVTEIHGKDASILKLEGKLSGPWVGEVDRCLRDIACRSQRVQVDLEEVSFVDSLGKDLLLRMEREGVSVIGYSGFLRHLLWHEEPARRRAHF